jgi:hypothetical protein
MATNLREQIWKDDVVDLIDESKSSAKVMHDWVERAQFQGAPPELVTRLTRIRDLYAEALEGLRDILPWFPDQPE